MGKIRSSTWYQNICCSWTNATNEDMHAQSIFKLVFFFCKVCFTSHGLAGLARLQGNKVTLRDYMLKSRSLTQQFRCVKDLRHTTCMSPKPQVSPLTYNSPFLTFKISVYNFNKSTFVHDLV